MSTQVMPPPPLSIPTIPSSSENEPLYEIIEKQRSIIQDLQYNLAKVTEERDLLLKQVNQFTSPQASPPDMDLYSRRPLPEEPTSVTEDAKETPTPYPSVSHSPSIMIPSGTISQDIPSPTIQMTNTTSPFDMLTPTFSDTNAKPFNSLSGLERRRGEHDFDNYYLDDDMHSTTKEPPMDEHDIMLYTKYHEAVRSRHGYRPQQTNSAFAFITHSPLPPPPQHHGPYPSRKTSAPATTRSVDQISTSSFLVGKSASDLTLSHPPLSQQQKPQQPYTLRKFIEDDLSLTMAGPLQRSISKDSANLEMVRYEDGYYDPSLEQEADDQVSGQTRAASPTDTPEQPPSSVPMLKDIRVQILSSNMTTNEKGKDIFSFTIAVGKVSPTLSQGMEELWRAEKLFSDFVNLDLLLKSKNHGLANKLCRLPDKSLFVSKAPSKVDERKNSMERYIQRVLTLPLVDMSDVCEFLSTNVLEQRTGPPKRKIGYLTKRGKNFGGWKMRFFVLDGPTVNYYENKGGQFLGTIFLSRAQIGSQVVQSGAGDSFRHAFLILEPKKSAPNGIHRHVLCADSDLERDQWVEAMSQYINYDGFGQPPPTPTSPDYRQQLNNYLHRSRSDTSSFKKNRKNSAQRHARQRSSLDEADLMIPKALHEPSLDDDKRNKARNFWGKKMFSGNNNSNSNDNVMQLPPGPISADQVRAMMNSLSADDVAKQTPQATKQSDYGPNQVFGIPLDDAVKVCRISQDYELPAVVYRCIEYLEAKDAAQEEGIYRLSGSAAKIKKLKEKFNQDGDVRLLELEEYSHEVHAISGLLKMWLRELPGSVLTTELMNDFLKIAAIDDRDQRTIELGRLVSLLPLSNYTLLRTLSAHLLRIVQNAGVNKMTVKNLSIVFGPNLNLPSVIFNLFLTEFDYVFWTKQDQDLPLLSPTAPTNNSASRSQSGGSTAITKKENNNINDTMPGPNSSQPPTIPLMSIHRRSNRNSIHYTDSAPQSIVGLEKRSQDFVAIIDEEDEDNTLGLDYEEVLDHQARRSPNGNSAMHEYTATVIEPQVKR